MLLLTHLFEQLVAARQIHNDAALAHFFSNSFPRETEATKIDAQEKQTNVFGLACHHYLNGFGS